MKTIICCLIAIWAVVLCSTTYGAEPNAATAHWSLEGGMGLGDADNGLILGAAMYWPAEDEGGIGLMVIGGEPVEGDEFAAGPCVEWPTGPIVATFAEVILPDSVANALGNVISGIGAGVERFTGPFQPYTRAGGLFDRDLAPTGVLGTSIRFRADKKIQPILRSDYFQPAGNADRVSFDGFYTSFNVMFLF